MNREPDFDASADMRIIELQRSALGLAPPQHDAWQSRLAFEPAFGLSEEPPAVGLGAVLAVNVAANPAREVIPGAVITLSLSLASDGAVPARDVYASVPIPGGASYRPGSFLCDGRPGTDEQANALFESGIAIAEIAPLARRTFIWKIGVKLGAHPLLVAPHVRATQCAVLGGRPLSISRRVSEGAFSAELSRIEAATAQYKPLIPIEISADELPIYELDTEEQLIYEAADAALSPMVAPRAVVLRYGRFDRTTLAFFQRVFNGSKDPTILQHCIFGGALACSTAADGIDRRLKAHVDAQSQLLHRLVLHEKLGKKEPIVDYGGELLAHLEDFTPASDADPDPVESGITLATELSEPTLAVLRRIFEERERWDFVKGRQFTLALQAQRAVALRDERAAATLENALRAYAQSSMAMLQRLFVRSRIDRSTASLFQSDPTLDQSARSLLGALAAALEPS